MQLETLNYARPQGWSMRPFPALDSDSTLVLVFAARGFDADGEALAELRAAYPRSRIVGCSSAGEIAGARVRDGSLSVAVARLEHSTIELARVLGRWRTAA
jgi:hypothetical protein